MLKASEAAFADNREFREESMNRVVVLKKAAVGQLVTPHKALGGNGYSIQLENGERA